MEEREFVAQLRVLVDACDDDEVLELLRDALDLALEALENSALDN